MKSDYITPAGFEKLREELDQLWKVERPKITQSVSEAAAQGDRSENAEYIYGKKRLREIDARVRFLTKRLDDLTVVESAPDELDRVYFGAWVTLEDEAGEQVCYRIVGPDESDAARGRISMDSPVGRSLLRREVGDEVTVNRPRGARTYTILEIDYRDPPGKSSRRR
ncbi:MAG: transcription elongation factor GreB [Proteobacteria bacterium]|nr:transcription elongation factor GreB [Pseudomonadota bacterium]